MIPLRTAVRRVDACRTVRALATTNDPLNATDSVPRRYETFYDDALHGVDALRATGVASDGRPNVEPNPMVTEPDTGVDVEVDQFILMEDEASTSTSTSGSDSSSSDYEGSDDDDGRADGERRSEPLRADIAADETAFADSSVAFKPAKPTADGKPRSDRRAFHSENNVRFGQAEASPSTTQQGHGDGAIRGRGSSRWHPDEDTDEPKFDPSEDIVDEVLGVGAPAPDSVEYKAKIEQLDSDPFGPDPDLLTDDAEPPPELLKRAAATAPHFEEGGAPI